MGEAGCGRDKGRRGGAEELGGRAGIEQEEKWKGRRKAEGEGGEISPPRLFLKVVAYDPTNCSSLGGQLFHDEGQTPWGLSPRDLLASTVLRA